MYDFVHTSLSQYTIYTHRIQKQFYLYVMKQFMVFSDCPKVFYITQLIAVSDDPGISIVFYLISPFVAGLGYLVTQARSRYLMRLPTAALSNPSVHKTW